tara:strand:+ start:829 stop:1446 length:618 start_codon:yes stop_codon:yes gene_type:complete
MLQFYSIGVISILSAISPGPDFVVITKYALCESRRHAFFCAFGIALGILVHMSYCLLGLALVISQSIVLFNAIKLLGAAYLIYLGIQGLRSPKKELQMAGELAGTSTKTAYQAFKEGFTINVLNPKCSLFMLSIFTMVIEPHTSIAVQAAYGFEIALIAFSWFCILASSISLHFVKQRFASAQHWVSRLTGVVLIFLGVKIALNK